MARTKRIQGDCQHCGGSLEFPAERIGLTAQCPRCGKETELMLATPPQEPMIPRKVIVWTVVTVALLVVGLIAVLAGLKHFERQAAEQRLKSGAPVQSPTNASANSPPAAGKR
jgi:uncharacterized paraquat-inducible protein A